ncbi:hypothetical protein LB456_09680 [Psychroflexus sp. CAK57W]|uniref:hypothetical protein n=1 Tax=Psychroflexus curvus TaxID=2873595 RepID=UPI001CCFC904|nr:hypothetical protein [Psychroflexus curvus]MBZ9787727.1 hypothetical protein [Psychroflexus curvus]
MDLQADIKWITEEIQTLKDPELVEAFKQMLRFRNKVSSERISIEQYNKEIEASIAQIDKGETYTHKEVGEHIKKWIKQ